MMWLQGSFSKPMASGGIARLICEASPASQAPLRASALQTPPPAAARKMKQYRMAASPPFTAGKKFPRKVSHEIRGGHIAGEDERHRSREQDRDDQQTTHDLEAALQPE
jgi:hypothetical protein